MKTIRIIVMILSLALVAMFASGCQESDKSKYEKAQSLMAKGEYTEAAEKFDELGAYEESSKLSMYCKAAAAGEAGDYATAFSTFETLGDYKESSFMLTYYKARQLESTAVDGTTIRWGNLIDAAELYTSNALFRDSKERAEVCKKTAYDYAVEWAGEKRYSTAIKVINALGDYSDSTKLSRYYDAFMTEQKNDYVGASEKFAALGDYKDAKEQVSLVMQRGYDAASELEAKGDQLGAYEAFIKLGEYNDSFERACKPYYLQGEALRAESKWDEAIEAFTRAGEYSDATTQILETRYQQAKNLYDQAEYKKAYLAYKKIAGYKDVNVLLSSDENLIAARTAREKNLTCFMTPGTIVTFGKYEQDNNIENGKEDIKWVVLDVQAGKSLLLSKYILDSKPYNNIAVEITWEECSLRKWLNDEFLQTAFSDEEQSAILITEVDNSASQGFYEYSSQGGKDTQDSVFLLSYAEAHKYLDLPDVQRYDKKSIKARATPTAYAIAQGIKVSTSDPLTEDGEYATTWWLRSPGMSLRYAATVISFGQLAHGKVEGRSPDDISGRDGIRPALWINLESDIF